MRLFIRTLLVLATAVFLPASASPQTAPNVTLELLDIDPANTSVIPLNAQVHGRIRYTTDAPVRLVLVPYRNGQPVETTNGGSPQYAPGSGETIAWFAFSSPRSIDEIRAVANDAWGHEFAHATIEKSLSWRAGAAAVPQAAWVAALKQAPKNIVEVPPSDDGFGVLLVVQLVFLLVPASVVLQIYALRKFEGPLEKLARISAFAMGALWLFVIVTAVAGSNLSPIWLVFLSPLFVLFLGTLFLVRSRSGRNDTVPG